ncbi:hypothetical protein ACPPVO_39765 [Dactylosporangium sp. McL0621]|uniref:hypothetical protein n=1 Tax=Dactylosporangium sp. McL0621 TaxID=3415678 RepID=UPI003CF05F67
MVTAAAEPLLHVPGSPVAAGAAFDATGERLALLVDGRLQVWGPGGRELDVAAAPGLTSVAVAGATVIGIGPDDLRFQLIGDLL